MHKLQLKITCWMAAGFFGLTFLILVAYTAHSVHWIFRYQKRSLRPIAESIAAELRAAGVAPGTPLSPAAAAALTEKLHFAAGNRPIGCAVMDREGNVLFRTPLFTVPHPERHFRVKKKRAIHFLAVKSPPGDVSDMLSKWYFLYRQEAGDLVIYLNSRQEYESVERFTEGAVVALLLALLLAILSGYLYSRRILQPLREVQAGLSRIRSGLLDTRIPEQGWSEEIRILVRRLNETFAELEDFFTRSADFSAAVAHELKTPLTAIQGNIEVCLGKERDPEEYREVLTETLADVNEMTRIVDQLLLLASPEKAADCDRLETFPLSEPIEHVLEVCQHAIEKKHIETRVTLQADPAIEGNRELITRMLHNLVHNAVKFSDPGGELAILLNREGEQAVLEIRDRGPGIAPADHQRIFDRFYKADPSRQNGRGLGLAIVQWIVNYHAGTIAVDSEPGKGACFRIVLPLRQKGKPARNE